MMVLAEELAKFTDLIGGPEYIPILLPPLENMAMQEETIVREKVPPAPRPRGFAGGHVPAC